MTGPTPDRSSSTGVRLRRLPAVSAVCLHTRGPYWKLSGAFARLRAAMDHLGLEAAGPPFGLFHDDPGLVAPEDTRYTLCYPVDTLAAERGRDRLSAPAGAAEAGAGEGNSGADVIEVLDFPEVEAATAEYRGPAAASPTVYQRVEEWIEERGYAADGPPREVYLAEPGTLGKGLMHAEVQQPVIRPPAPEAR